MEKIPQPNSIDREELRERLTNLARVIGENSSSIFLDEVLKKSKELKSKYGDKVMNHAFYHILIGSSPDYTPVDIIAEDFPDGEVQEFLKELEDKYLPDLQNS